MISRSSLPEDRLAIGRVVVGRHDEMRLATRDIVLEIDVERRPFVEDGSALMVMPLATIWSRTALTGGPMLLRPSEVMSITCRVAPGAAAKSAARIEQRIADRGAAFGQPARHGGEDRAELVGVGIAGNDRPGHDDHLVVDVRPLDGRDGDLLVLPPRMAF